MLDTQRTYTAVLQFNGVGEVCSGAVGRVAPARLVISHELGINVDGRDVVDNAADLEALAVLQEVAKHRGFACDGASSMARARGDHASI